MKFKDLLPGQLFVFVDSPDIGSCMRLKDGDALLRNSTNCFVVIQAADEQFWNNGTAMTTDDSDDVKLIPIYAPDKDAVWQDYAANRKFVEAINEYRKVYGTSLKESKDAVEEWSNKNGVVFP